MLDPTSPLREIIDIKTGIVQDYRIIRPLQKYPRLWLAFAKACKARDVGAISEPYSGGGIGETEAEATYAAIGEVVERYCASFVPMNIVIAARKNLAGDKYIPTSDELNHLHSDKAPGFSPLTETGNARWCMGWLAHNGLETYAPWSLVCLGATADSRNDLDECYPGPSISTGLACGPSLEEAAARAILESCERDAAMLAWYGRYFRGRLAHSLIETTWPLLARETYRCGLSAHIIDVTTDLEVPSFISVITPSDMRYRAAFGMASGLSAMTAARRAFIESLQTWMWADTSLDQAEPITRANIGQDFSDFESRVVAYGCGLMQKELISFFDAVDASSPIEQFDCSQSTPLCNYVELASRLANKGHSVQLFDVTTDDVGDVGLYVIRSICPTLQLMEAVHDFRKPNRVRLLQLLGQADYTDVPHPFP